MPEEDNSLDASGGSKLYDATSSSLETTAPVVQAIPARRRPSLFKFNRLAFTVTGGTLAAIAIIVGLAFLFNQVQNSKASEIAGKKGSYDVSTISTNGIQQNESLKVGTADSLDVNGQLQVSNTVVLTPTEAPATPEAGQIYYDKVLNSLFYYNGSVFVPVANQNSVVSSLGGLTGAINPGAGLSAVGGSLQNTGVLSIQGQTGNVTFTAGGGVEISGTTISTVALPAGQLVLGTGASGFTTVAQASGAGQCLISTLGAPVFGSCTGSTQVTSLNGLINGLTLAEGTGIDITDNGSNIITIASTAAAAIASINGENGPTLTISNASVTAADTITINNALADGSTKGIAAFNATNFTSSTPGIIDTIQGISTSASPTFANLTSSGYLKGTALRNASDVVFTLPVTGSGSSRTLCYVDNSSNTNCPTGGDVTYGATHTSNKITALDGSGNLVDSELATLTGGLQYAGSGYLLDLVSGSTSTLTVDNSGAGVANLTVTGKITATQGLLQGTDTYTLASNGGNGGELCYVYLGISNCPTGGDVSYDTSGGQLHSAGTLAMFTASGVADSVLLQSGGNLSTTGSLTATGGIITNSITSNLAANSPTNDLVITSSNNNIQFSINGGARVFTFDTGGSTQYQTICTTGISCASGGGTAVLLGGSGAQNHVTSDPGIWLNTTVGTGALLRLQVSGSDRFVVNSQGEVNNLRLAGGGTPGTDYVSLSGGTQTGSATLTIPNLNGVNRDICLSSGNCIGSGVGVGGSGTTDTIAMFTASGTIGNSTLTQSGGNLTASGDVIVQGGSVTLGLASTQTGSLGFKHSGSAFTGTLIQDALSGDQTYTLPDESGEVCLTSGNCIGGSSGGAPSNAQYLTLALDSGLTAERVLTAGTNIASFVDGGANGTLTVSVANNPTFSGLVTANGGLTIETGDTFTFNGDAFTDLTGTGLQITGGALQTTLGTSVDLASEVTGTLPVSNGGTGSTSFNTNGILYGNGAGAVLSTGLSANAILATDGSGVPDLVSTLPTAVQGNITSTGILAGGSIGGAFGSISTGNNISTTANVQGANVNATTQIQLGGADINVAGTLTNVAYLNAGTNNFTGSASIQGSLGLKLGGGLGGSAGQLGIYRTSGGYVTLKALDAAGSYDLSIPAITANDTVCLETFNNCAGAGASAVGAIDGGTPNGNGATISSNTLYLQFATGALPGLVSVDTQTFAGAKTFTGNLLQSGVTTFGTGTGAVSLNGSTTVTNGVLNVGQGTTAGSLTLATTSGSSAITISAAARTGNLALLIPTDVANPASDTLCLQSLGNCSGAGASSVGTIDTGGTPVANGAVIASNVLYLQSATALYPGLVNTDTQTFAGAKTFNALGTFSAGLTASGAASSINASSNFATNINTGNSTGAVSIGNSLAGTIALQSAGSINLTPGGTGNTGVIIQPAAASTNAFRVNNHGGSPMLVVDSNGGEVQSTRLAVAVGNATSALDVTQNSTGNILRAYDGGTAVLTIADGGGTIFRNSVNSTTGFQVQNSAGTSTLLNVDTTNAGVSVGNGGLAGTLQIGNTTGAVAQTINIGNNATASSATTVVLGSTIGTSPVTLQSGTSGLLVKGANGATAFQVQNAAGSSLLNMDTIAGNLISNGSFEANATGWTTVSRAGGSGSPGSFYAAFPASAASGGSSYSATANLTGNLSTSTQYTLSFYAQTYDPGFVSYTPTLTASFGGSACSATAPSANSWTRYTCTITTGGGAYSTVTFSNTLADQGFCFIFCTPQTLIDGVRLEAGGSATSYRDSDIAINSNFIAPVLIGHNNTSALKVTNSAGITLLNADTTNMNVAVTSNTSTGTAFNVGANSLTTGTGLSVASTSAALQSGNLAYINHTATVTTPIASTNNLLNVSRAITTGIPASPVVTLDNANNGSSGGSSASWTHTIGNYTNRAIVISAGNWVSSSGQNPTCTATYGGVSMTLLSSANHNVGSYTYKSFIFGLAAPATGANTAAVSCNMGNTTVGESVSWYNVDQSTPFAGATSTTSSGTSASLTVSGTTTSDKVVDSWWSAGFPTPGAGQTGFGLYSGSYVYASYKNGAAGSTGISWTTTLAPTAYSATAVKAVATPSTSISGAVASFSSNCTATSGGCTDTANILSLNQQYASATGAVLRIQNAGSGPDIQLGSGIIRPSTDSTTAVRLQNATGTSTLLNADTTNMTLTVGPTVPAPVFATKVDYTTGTNPSGVAIGDVNGDGKADLVAANGGGGFGTTVSVLLNAGSGTFAAKVDYTTGAGPNSVALGDLNGDGYLDIVTANGGASGAGTTISVLINNGNGTFATHVPYTVGTGPSGVALGDTNGDSKLDIAVANQTTSTVSTLTNKGNGTFNTKVDYATAADPWDVALADVNADGKTDMLVSNTTPNSVSVYINSAVIGTFAAKVDYSTGASTAPRGIDVADLNADGKPDVVTGNYGNNTTSVLLNSGTGTFPSSTTYATASGTFDIALADLNGDGRRDIATANTTGATVSVLMNTGSGAFGTKTDYAAGTNSNKIALGDVNSDGRPDIATSNNTATSASIFINGSVSLAVSGHSSFGRISLQGGLTVAGLSLFQDSILSRNSVNSNSAFAIQNSAGVNLLNADTVNMRVSVGSRGTATGQLFIAGDMPAAALSSTGGANNTWGVDVEGRYAYIATAATTNGLQVFDVSNPASPLQFGSANASSSAKKRIKVQGKYAYTASAGVSGTGTFEIFDISNPKTPVSVGSQTYTTTGSGNQPALYVQGRYAYVGDGSTRTLWVFDVANPASMPTAIQLTTGASGSGIADIYAQGRYVYLAESGATATAQFQIIDMNNPLVPTIVGTVSNTYISGAVTSLAVQGRVAYVGNSTGTIYAVDIKDPTQASPSVTSVAMGGAAAGLYAQGRTLYVADSTSNLIRSVDISTPGTPLGITGTSPMTGGASAQSLLVAGRYLYAVTSSSPTNTLQIFDLGGTYSQQLEAGGVETDTLTVRANSNIAGDQTIQGGLTVGGSTNLQGDMAVVGTSKFSGNLTGTSYATATATYSTTVGASVNTTSVTVNSATGFAAGDVIFINNAGQDYYTRITNIASNTFTVTPAVDVDANSGATPAVTKYVTQNIGAVSTGAATPSLSDRFFQGYFLGGVVTGAGSTTLSDGNLQSTGKMNYTATGHLFTSTATTTSGLSVTANSLTTGSAINLTVSPTYTTVSTNSPGALNITRSVTANPTIPAVTVDQTFAVATSNTSGANSRTATTNAATLANQTNMFIVAHVAATGGFTNYSCSMTYNGNSMTDVSTGGLFGSGTNSYTFIYATPTPNASGTIVASCSDPSYGNQLYNVIVAGNSFYNVSTYAGYAAGSGSSTPTFSLNSGDLAVDGAYNSSGVPTNGWTQRAAASSAYTAAMRSVTSSTGASGVWPGSPWANRGIILRAPVSPVTINGNLANISSTCTVVTGSCVDSSVLLNLNQQYASATGNVLNISNSGSGNAIDVTNSAGKGLNITSSGTATGINITNSGTGTSIFANNTSTGKSVDIQSAGTSVFTISNTASSEGAVLFKNRTNNSAAFTIQNAAGSSLLNISTTPVANPGSLITNGSFETDTSGWTTLSRVGSNASDGSYSGYMSTASTATATATLSSSLLPSTTYTLTYHMSGMAAYIGTLTPSFAGQNCTAKNWFDSGVFTCTLTTPASPSYNTVAFALTVGFGTGTVNIDAVRIEQGSTSSGYGTVGSTTLAGNLSLSGYSATINSATTINNTALVKTNSATAFQVQDASGNAMLTLSTNNYLAGSGNYLSQNAVLKVAADSGTGRSINAVGSINNSNADFAEWIPWFTAKPTPGSVIEYQGNWMVVSSTHTAAFIGNDGIYDAENAILVTLTGQVPVKISSPVSAGDYLVPNGDGTARGVAPANATLTDYFQKVGVAIEASSGVTVKALVNAPGASAAFNPQANTSFTDINISGTLTVNNLEVSGTATFNGNIIVGGHVITAGNTPDTQVLSAAGAGATITIDGNDTAGTITITTGGGATAGDLGKLIFSNAFGKAPKTILSAQDEASQDAKIFPSGKSASQFILRTSQALPAGTYTFDYFIVQ